MMAGVVTREVKITTLKLEESPSRKGKGSVKRFILLLSSAGKNSTFRVINPTNGKVVYQEVLQGTMPHITSLTKGIGLLHEAILPSYQVLKFQRGSSPVRLGKFSVEEKDYKGEEASVWYFTNGLLALGWLTHVDVYKYPGAGNFSKPFVTFGKEENESIEGLLLISNYFLVIGASNFVLYTKEGKFKAKFPHHLYVPNYSFVVSEKSFRVVDYPEEGGMKVCDYLLEQKGVKLVSERKFDSRTVFPLGNALGIRQGTSLLLLDPKEERTLKFHTENFSVVAHYPGNLLILFSEEGIIRNIDQKTGKLIQEWNVGKSVYSFDSIEM